MAQVPGPVTFSLPYNQKQANKVTFEKQTQSLSLIRIIFISLFVIRELSLVRHKITFKHNFFMV
jgi:hypothetical protein